MTSVLVFYFYVHLHCVLKYSYWNIARNLRKDSSILWYDDRNVHIKVEAERDAEARYSIQVDRVFLVAMPALFLGRVQLDFACLKFTDWIKVIRHVIMTMLVWSCVNAFSD